MSGGPDHILVDAIARRVVELLRAETPTLPARGHVDTATVARLLGMGEDWVREHAAELGAVRLGDGKRGELRYDVRAVRQALERRRVTSPAPQRARRQPGPRRRVVGVELLPLPDRRDAV